MATTSRLVPRASWRIAILGLCALCCIFAIALVIYRIEFPRYVIRDEALDGAVVDGVAKAERSPLRADVIPRVVVVPHHLVASEAIARGVALIAQNSEIQKVVVISPDHFAKCAAVACTTFGSFDTFFGDIEVDRRTVRSLSNNALFAQSSLFQNEHGVYSIVPFIKHYLPSATVVPVVVSVASTEGGEARIELAHIFTEMLKDEKTALVISTDFSHYLPYAEAELMDFDTQSVLCQGRLEYIRALKNPEQSDCPLCLWIATTVATSHEARHPTTFWRSNSAKLLRDLSAQETTSHFGIYYSNTPSAVSCTEEF